MRVFKYIGTADLTKDGYNWLCKIVQNVANDFKRKTEGNFPLEEISATRADESIEDAIADKDMLLRELGKLTEYDRQIMLLRFWQDHTIDQIAAETKRSKSAIHKRILILIDEINKNLNG